jgi:uncharacterized protein YuzE
MSVHIGPYTFDGVTYDAEADVLYLSVGDTAKAVNWDETPDGHGISFDEHGDLVGLTIVDARRLVEEADGELTLDLPVRASSADLQHSFALSA